VSDVGDERGLEGGDAIVLRVGGGVDVVDGEQE